MLRGAWWAALAGLVVVPVVLALGSEHHGVATTSALLTGVLAASLLVAAVVLPSRLGHLTRAFGIERLLRGHRRFALATLALVVAHVVLVVAADHHAIELLDVRTAPDRARAAVGSTVAMGVLCLMATARRARRHYALWRLVHLVLASCVLVLAGLHIYWLDHLIRDTATRWLFTAVAAGLVAMLAHRWLYEPFVARSRPYTVLEVRAENSSTSTVVLAPRHGYQPGLRFAAGQFAWIRLDSPFALREEHPFTIASGAHDHRRLEFTVREVGDFTRQVRQLAPGRTVYLDGPHGSFSLDSSPGVDRAAGVVMVAAGVGMTPMMSMLRTLAHQRDRRSHLVIQGARTPDDLLFRSELAQLQRVLDLRVVQVLSAPTPEWTGWVGRIDEHVLRTLLPRSRRRPYFLCGPPVMVTQVSSSLRRLGVPMDSIYTELFDMV